ncbi:hypothetical protein J6TS2_11270 [Heyndrickxia sporothermodurans]|nr:hypothetical protein J6TS2_11270 [Heyndrickxia sporothermodurans]
MKKTRVVSSQKNTQSKVKAQHLLPHSLMGKHVTVYRGVRESNSGKLIDVQSDYVTLYSNKNNKNTVIYYKIEQIKSISEDSKNNSIQALSAQQDDSEIEFYSADNFVDLAKNFVNKSIQINQGGPDSKYGVLQEVTDDYLVVNTEDDGVVFYNTHHIKSITEYNNQMDENDESSSDDRSSRDSRSSRRRTTRRSTGRSRYSSRYSDRDRNRGRDRDRDRGRGRSRSRSRRRH